MTANEWVKIYNAKDGTWDKDDLIDKAYDVINRLTAENEKLNDEKLKHFLAYEKDRKRAKSEAIKEFAEKLKNCFAISGDYLDIINIINNLVKEMERDTK